MLKNQYYGDINDYKKYSLIRNLTGSGKMRIAVCWALTDDDGFSDGSKINYLKEPLKWKRHDPIVFEQLRNDLLIKKERNIENIEISNIICNGKFFKRLLKDGKMERDRYFEEFLNFANNADLIFFDPDNGLEINSIPRGRIKSSKYIYLSELENFYRLGKSLLIYQHFPRVNREQYTSSLASKIFYLINAPSIFMFITSHVLFLLIPQPSHAEQFRRSSKEIERYWENIIKVKEINSQNHFNAINNTITFSARNA